MPTIAGMRRRGVTPEALRDFAELIGVAKNNSVVDIGKFEFAVRGDLEARVARGRWPCSTRCRLTVTNWPRQAASRSSTCPGGRPSRSAAAARKVPFGRRAAHRARRLLRRPAAGLEAAGPRAGGPARGRLRDPLRRGRPRARLARWRRSAAAHDPASPEAAGTGRRGRGPSTGCTPLARCRPTVRLYDRLFSVEQPDAAGELPRRPEPGLALGGARGPGRARAPRRRARRPTGSFSGRATSSPTRSTPGRAPRSSTGPWR